MIEPSLFAFVVVLAVVGLFGGTVALAAIASGAAFLAVLGLGLVGGSVFLAGLVLSDSF